MRIAITGGIAEGKSTLLGYVHDLGFETLSSDDLARRAFDDEVRSDLERHVGSEIVNNRDLLRRLIAEDPWLRRRLNRLTHPRVLALILQSRAEFVEVPLLVEACLQGAFDRVWVATCGPEEQLRRLIARVGEEEEARRLLATQLPTAVKEVFADVVVRTNAPEETVRHVVSEEVRRR
jgi:dephospho-CoA kinase